MAASGMFSELSDDALKVYKNIALSLIANSNGAEYDLFSLYNNIGFATSQKYYPGLSYRKSPFDLGFVSGIVDSLKDKGLVDILENENEVDKYSITDSGLEEYEKLSFTCKIGVRCV
ncbi:MAG: hypothetical protein KAS11_01090 [Candidatus Aenigmarchaeota archaeon]|nr:hypothetical protein [Candidatus Aenigmarchaeota archaeon]